MQNRTRSTPFWMIPILHIVMMDRSDYKIIGFFLTIVLFAPLSAIVIGTVGELMDLGLQSSPELQYLGCFFCGLLMFGTLRLIGQRFLERRAREMGETIPEEARPHFMSSGEIFRLALSQLGLATLLVVVWSLAHS